MKLKSLLSLWPNVSPKALKDVFQLWKLTKRCVKNGVIPSDAWFREKKKKKKVIEISLKLIPIQGTKEASSQITQDKLLHWLTRKQRNLQDIKEPCFCCEYSDGISIKCPFLQLNYKKEK